MSLSIVLVLGDEEVDALIEPGHAGAWCLFHQDGREFSAEEYDMVTEEANELILDRIADCSYSEPDGDEEYDRLRDEGMWPGFGD